MTAAREAEAFAPASVGNVALGFDVARRGVRIAAITGVGRDLPLEADRNTAGVALSALAEALDLDHGFEIAIVKGIPLGSGLGGSASAVAALVAANALVDRPVDDVALLTFAMQGEKAATGAVHVDNVAPSLFGGLVLTVGIHEPHVTRIPVPPGIRCVLVHPHIELSTRAAREVLRAAVPRAVDARVARDHGLSLYGVRLDGRRRLLLETPDHLELFDVAPDGRALAAHYPARQVILAGRAADAEERMLSVVDGSFLHQISGEGRNLVYQDPTGLRFRHGDDAAVRLAPLEGWSGWSALSPDARLIATVLKGPGAPLTLIPTGAGEPRPVTDLDSVVWSGWLEAGRLLVARSHLGQLDLRDYDLATGRSTAVAANLSSTPWEPSHDPQVGADAFQLWRTSGRLAILSNGALSILDVRRGAVSHVPGRFDDYTMAGWGPGDELFVYRIGDVPARVMRLGIATGALDLWREMAPLDRSGLWPSIRSASRLKVPMRTRPARPPRTCS